MPRNKRSAKAVLVKEQEKRPDKARTEYVLSPVLANATLRLPPEEEEKVLRVEKLRMEVAQEREKQRERLVESEGSGFIWNEDYRTVKLKGVAFTLTSGQAQIIQMLHEAQKSGVPDLGNHYILEKLGTPSGRWQDTFKSNPDAKKALIKTGKRKGTLRLNV